MELSPCILVYMPGKRRIALVGDYNPAVIAHQAIPEALRLAGLQTGDKIEGIWLHTSSIADPTALLRDFAGIWCVPASPYANADAAVEAIQYAREQGRPPRNLRRLPARAAGICPQRVRCAAAHAEDNPRLPAA